MISSGRCAFYLNTFSLVCFFCNLRPPRTRRTGRRSPRCSRRTSGSEGSPGSRGIPADPVDQVDPEGGSPGDPAAAAVKIRVAKFFIRGGAMGRGILYFDSLQQNVTRPPFFYQKQKLYGFFFLFLGGNYSVPPKCTGTCSSPCPAKNSAEKSRMPTGARAER